MQASKQLQPPTHTCLESNLTSTLEKFIRLASLRPSITPHNSAIYASPIPISLEKPISHSPSLSLMTPPHPMIPSLQAPLIFKHTHPTLGRWFPSNLDYCLLKLVPFLNHSICHHVAINALPNKLSLIDGAYEVFFLFLLVPPIPSKMTCHCPKTTPFTILCNNHTDPIPSPFDASAHLSVICHV
ncbi:unnamed protein product [Trifolium pratense]|uniref:Uncharacterized protein n=1 Tax=Trifolium pratense TaxID=57577 RepID=A0ACB0KU95_TRIPR|nr:unnamed protein product [Trifolium pratense]